MLEAGLMAAPTGQLPKSRGMTLEFRARYGVVVAVTFGPDVEPADRDEAMKQAKAAISQLAASQTPTSAPAEIAEPIRIDDGALFRSWAIGSG